MKFIEKHCSFFRLDLVEESDPYIEILDVTSVVINKPV